MKVVFVIASVLIIGGAACIFGARAGRGPLEGAWTYTGKLRGDKEETYRIYFCDDLVVYRGPSPDQSVTLQPSDWSISLYETNETSDGLIVGETVASSPSMWRDPFSFVLESENKLTVDAVAFEPLTFHRSLFLEWSPLGKYLQCKKSEKEFNYAQERY